MRDHRLPSISSPWHVTDSRWDWFFLVVLAGLLVLLLLSLGGVEAWSELVVVGVAVLLAVGLLLRSWLDAGFRLARSWAYLPLLAILALSVGQLLPLPSGVVARLSPRAAELREELLGDAAVPSAEQAEVKSTLSLYPLETAHDLRMALVFAALFVVAASVFRSSEQIVRALQLVFAMGCAEAGIALLQIITLSTKIHWTAADRGQVVTSGSFINYSHFCQFLNLALGAGIALLLVRMREDSHRDRGGASRLTDLRGDRYLRPISGIVLCAVAVLTSMSRNGGISLFIAAGVIGVLLYRRGVLSVRGWLMGMVPLGIVVVLFLTCFDLVYDRFTTLEDGQALGGRLEVTAGTLRAWQDFSVWGAGLGTHEYVFPLYDSAVTTSLAEHADNDWAQLLEEFGVLGGAAVLAFVASIFWVAGKLMFWGHTPLSTAAFGLCIGLLAVAWHSLSDFGQHLPGVFSLTALLSGLLVAIARHERQAKLPQAAEAGQLKTGGRRAVGAVLGAGSDAGGGSSYSAPPRWPLFRYLLGAVGAGGVVLVCGWGVAGAMAAYRGEAWSNVAFVVEQRLEGLEWAGSDQEYVDLLAAAEGAVVAEPNNVKYGYLLNLYRWRSISRARDPETGSILLDAGVLPFVAQIADELAQVRALCPTYGLPYGLEGELRLQVLDEPAGSQLIQQAARLTPYDAGTCLLAGQLAATEGRMDEAVVLLSRAVALEPRQFGAVANLYLGELGRVDLALELVGDNDYRMGQLAQLLDAQVEQAKLAAADVAWAEPDAASAPAAQQPAKQLPAARATGPQPSGSTHPAGANYAELAQQLRERALLLLRERVAAGEASPGELAQLAGVEMRANQPAAAIELYRGALAQDYGQVGWRLALVRALVAAGEADQAMREAKIVLRLEPRSQAAIELIKEISVLPVR